MIKQNSKNSLKTNVRQAYNLSEKFNTFSKKSIVPGSDEHLDIISKHSDVLNQLVSVLSDVNNLIEQHFPAGTEEAEELKLSLHSLHSSLDMFINKIKNNPFTAHSFSISLELLESENKQVFEYINDINEFILSDEDKIDDTFLLED